MESQEENNFMKPGDNTVPPESVYDGGNLKVSAVDVKVGSDSEGVQMSKPVQEPSVEMETDECDIAGDLPVLQSEINKESGVNNMESQVTDSESTLGIRNIFSSTLNESILNQSSVQLSFTMNTSNISQHDSPLIASNKSTASLTYSDLTPRKSNMDKSSKAPLDGSIDPNSKSANPLSMVNNVFYQDKNDATPIQLTKRQKFSLSPFVQNSQLNKSQCVTSAQNQSINSIALSTIEVNKSLNESSQSASRKNLFESSITAPEGGNIIPEITNSADGNGTLGNVQGEPSFLPLDNCMEIEKSFSAINISNTEIINNVLLRNNTESTVTEGVIITDQSIYTSQTDIEQLQSMDGVCSETNVNVVNILNMNPGEIIENNSSNVNLSLNNGELLSTEGADNVPEVSLSQSINEMSPNVILSSSVQDSTSLQVTNPCPPIGEPLNSTAENLGKLNDSYPSIHTSDSNTFVDALKNNSANMQSLPNSSVLNSSVHSTTNQNSSDIATHSNDSIVDVNLPKPKTSLDTSVLNASMGINILYKSSNEESQNTSFDNGSDVAKIMPESEVSLSGFNSGDVEDASHMHTSETITDKMPKVESTFNISASNSTEVFNCKSIIGNTTDNISITQINFDNTDITIGNKQEPESAGEGTLVDDGSIAPTLGSADESAYRETVTEGDVDKIVPKAESFINPSLLESSIAKLSTSLAEETPGIMTSQNTSLIVNAETNSASKPDLTLNCTSPNNSQRFSEVTGLSLLSQNLTLDASKTTGCIYTRMVDVSLSDSTLNFSMGISQLNKSTDRNTSNVDMTETNTDVISFKTEMSVIDSSEGINSKYGDNCDVEMVENNSFIDSSRSNSDVHSEKNEMLLSCSNINLQETNQLNEFKTEGTSVINKELQNTDITPTECNKKDTVPTSEISLNSSTLNSTLGITQLYNSMTEVAADVPLMNTSLTPFEDKGNKGLKSETSFNSSGLMDGTSIEIDQHSNTIVESTTNDESVEQIAALVPSECGKDKDILKTEVSLGSSELNSSLGINHLHKSTIECTPDIEMLVQNDSQVQPEDMSFNADKSLNNTSLNSSLEVNHLHEATTHCSNIDMLIQNASHFLAGENEKNLKAGLSMNNSALHKSTAECSAEVDMLVQDAPSVPSKNTEDKSLEAEVSLNSTMGINQLYTSVNECSSIDDTALQTNSLVLAEGDRDMAIKTDTCLNNSEPNSSLGIGHHCKLISDVNPDVESTPQNNFDLSEGNGDETVLPVKESLNCSTVSSSMQFNTINESVSESSQVVEISTCNTSPIDTAITCSAQEGNKADDPSPILGINDTNQSSKLIPEDNNLGLDGTNSNDNSNSPRQVVIQELIVVPSSSRLSKDCETLKSSVLDGSLEMDNSEQRITEAFKNNLVPTQSTLFDNTINVDSNQSFTANGKNEIHEEEEEEEIMENRLLESFSEKNPIEATNETKYFFKDIDMTCINTAGQYKTDGITRSNLFDVNRSPGNFVSDDMEVTIIKERNPGNANLCNVSVDEKSFNLNYTLDYIDEGAMEITTQNLGSSENFTFQKPFAQTKSNNPEVTILGEETILMCQSIIHDPDEVAFESGTVKDKPSVDPANSNKAEVPEDQERDDSPKDESVRYSVSLDETSMCALDYSLPLSDCTNLASKSLLNTRKEYYQLSNVSALLNLSRKSVGHDKSTSEKDLSTNSVEGESTPVKNANNSGFMWDSFMNERSSLPMRKSLNITSLTSEERRLLSETINKTICSENLSPHEEITSLKENLFVVMDLLEKENSEFEAFKISCEKEKFDLVSKINLLEKTIADMKKDSDVSNANDMKIAEDKLKAKEEELSELMMRYNLTEEKLRQTKNDLECLRNLFFLTETEIPQFSELLSSLNSFGVSTEGIMMEGTENVIHLKNILNVLSSLLVKHNSLVSRYSELIESSKEDKSKLAALEEVVHNMGQKEKDVVELQSKCIQLQSTLEHNQNLVTDLQSQLSSFNGLKDSFEKSKIESEAMRENISKLKDELALSLERDSEASSKCEILTQELSQAIENYQSLQSDNKELLIKYEETSEKLINFEGIERKYIELEKQYESLERVRNDYDLLKEDFTKLKEELSLSNKNNTEISLAFEKLNEEIRESNEKYEHLKVETNDLLNNYEKTSEKLLNLEEIERKYLELVKHCDSLESYKSNYGVIKEEFTKLEEKLELANKNITEMSSTCERLNEELKVSNEKYEYLKVENNNLLHNYDKSSERITNLEEIERKYTELQNYCESLETCKNDYGILKEEFSKLQENLLFGENRYTEVSSICERLNLELKESYEKYESLKIEKSDLLSNYEKTSERVIILEEIERKYIELEKHCEYLETCKTEYDSLKEEFSKLKEELELGNRNHTDLSSMLDKLNEELRESNEKYEALKIENHDLLNNYEKTSERVIILEEIERKYIELEKHCEYLETCKTEYDSLKEEFSKLKEELELGNRNHTDLSSMLDKLNEELRESNEKYEALKIENHDLLNNYEKTSERVIILEEIERKYIELEKHCEYLETCKTEYDSLKEEFTTLKEKFSISSEKNVELTSKCEALDKDLTESVNELESVTKVKDEIFTKYEKCMEDLVHFENLDAKYFELEKKCEFLELQKIEFDSLKESFVKLKDELTLATDENSMISSKCEALAKELEEALERYQSLKNENDDLSSKFLKSKEDIASLEDIERKFTDLSKHCEDLTEKCKSFEDSFNRKVSDCEEFSKQNEHLKNEVQCLNGLLEETKKATEQEAQSLKDICIALKNKFNEQSHSLDEKIAEIDLMIEANDVIRANIESVKNIVDLNVEDNLFPTSELKSLLLQFEEVSLKYTMLDNVKTRLKQNYDEASEKIKDLENNLALETESKNKCLEEISVLNTNIIESSDNLSELQRKYDSILSQSDSDSARLACLIEEIEGLKLNYNESLLNVANLEAMCSEKSENNKILEGTIETLNLNIGQKEESLALLKGEYETLASKYETESAELKVLQNDHAILEKQYTEASITIEDLQKLSSERAEINEKNKIEIDSLQKEVNNLNENLLNINKQFEDILSKYEKEQEKVSTIQSEMTSLLEKYEGSSAMIEKLQQENKEKCEDNEKLEKDLANLTLELEENKEILAKLKLDYEVSLLNIKNECSKLESLEKEHSDLQIKFDSLTKERDALDVEYLQVLEINQQNLSEIESSEIKLNQLTEELTNLRNDHNGISLKLESALSELTSLQSEYSKLDTKYLEIVTAKETLEKESADKDLLREKLEEEKKLRSEEFTNLQANFDELSSEHEELKVKYNDKCSESTMLFTDKTEIESKYNDALANIKGLEDVCSAKSEINEKLDMEVSDLKNELANLRSDFESVDSKLKEASACYAEEKGKYETLKQDYDKLSHEFEEASTKIRNLESECLSSSESNQSLFEEVSKLKLEVLNLSESLSDMKSEYNELTIKHTDECTKHAELRGLYEGIEANYQESLTWMKEIAKESLGEAWEEQDDLQTHESNYDNFNSALSGIKLLKEQSSSNKEINENLQKEIGILKEKSSASEIEIIELNKNFESLQNKFEEENSKCLLLQEQLKDIEVKYSNAVAKLTTLEEDISNKNLENCEIQSQNEDLKNDIIELTNNKSKLQEELKIITEKSNSLDQECVGLKKDIEILREEKILREELERRNSDLQAQCMTLEEDLAVKIKNLERLESDYQSLEEKLNSEKQSLMGKNGELQKQLSEFSNKVDHLSSDLENLKLKNSCLEEDLERKHSELRNATLKIENFKYYEELIQNIKTDHPFFVEKYIENEFTSSENSIFDTFFPSVERVLKELSRVGDEYAANKSLLTQTQEEVEELQAEVKSLSESLQESQSKSLEVAASYESLQEKFSSLMENHSSIKESYEILSQKADALSTENKDLKQLNRELADQVEGKFHIASNLQDLQQKYESLVATNNDVMSMLSEKSKENEDCKRKLSENEQHLSTLRVEVKKNLTELNLLKEDRSTLQSELDKCSVKISSLMEDIEKIEAENKKIRSEKVKFEKEYQNAIDNLRKTQEKMCEVEKECNERMSRFTYVLKEKEDFENESLSLLKRNDELTTQIKSLSAKVEDYDKSFNKLQELQSAYSVLVNERNALETQVTELQKYKNEIIDLKANLAMKDSKINEILNEKKQIKTNFQQKSDEIQELVEKVCSLLPGAGGFTETLSMIGDKLNQINALQEELADEKAKSESLDEECNVLNADLEHKDKMMGQMYRDHAIELEKFKSSLEEAEEASREHLSENKSLKERLQILEKDLEDLKTSQPTQCVDCVQLKETLQKAETDLTENQTKVTSLEKHLEQFQSSYKKKVAEYRKKLEALDQSLKKHKASSEEKAAENEQFKERISALETELTSLKSSGTGSGPCTNCAELTQVKSDLAERNTKITSLEKHLENFQTSYKKKAGEYKKKLEALDQSLKKHKASSEEKAAENEQFKERISALETELTSLKSSGTRSGPCTNCAELTQVKSDLADRNTKITSLEKHLEHFQTSYKKKTGEYKKKILSLQEKLSSKEKVGDENQEPVRVPSLEAECQTEASPLQLTGQSGIVQTAKMREQEEKLHKMEKENQILKKVCHNRLQTIRDMQAKYENRSPSVDALKKAAASRSALSEVKNNK